MMKHGWKSKLGKVFSILLSGALIFGDCNLTAFAQAEQSGQETGYEAEVLLEDAESSDCVEESMQQQAEDGQETAGDDAAEVPASEEATEAIASEVNADVIALEETVEDLTTEDEAETLAFKEVIRMTASEETAESESVDAAEAEIVLTEETVQTVALQESCSEEVQTAEEEETLLLDSTAGSSSNYQNLQNENNWASTVKSYLVYLEDGTYMRVDGSSDRLLVEYYNEAFQKTSSKTVAMQQPIFGGFYAGKDFYYVVYGKKNTDESDSNVVMEVVKYDSTWKEITQEKITGQNTYTPFEAGSLRMTEYGGYLYIRTAHTMYAGTDGLHHQANWTLQLRESDLTLVDSYSCVSNLGFGYVSHSFNQFILVDDNQNLVALDHGDANPRGILLGRYATKAGTESFQGSYDSQVILAFQGSSGNNYTGASVGGFAYSTDNYLVAGATVAQDDDWTTHAVRNVVLSVTSKSNLSENKLTFLTSYGDSDGKTVTTPHLVKISDDSFLLLWGIRTVSQKNGYTSYSETGTISYVFLDGNGNKTSKVFTGKGYLSDCEPIVADGKVVWYTTYKGTIAYYLIDSDGNLSASATLGEDESGTATGSYFESSLKAATTVTISKQYYTSKAIVPADDSVTLVVSGNRLKQGKDYEITCTNNTEVGKATAVLTGIGNYQDSITVTFKIVQRPMSKVKFDLSEFVSTYAYDGEAKCPKVGLYIEVDGEKIYLEQGQDKDYVITYEKNVSAGTGVVKLTGLGNYTGTKSKKFKITKYEITDSTDFVASVSSDFVYQKGGLVKTFKEAVLVTFKGKTLKLGVDYTLLFKNASPSKSYNGYATCYVTVKGKGSYTGKKVLQVRILTKDLSLTTITADDVIYKEKAGNYKSKPTLLDTNGKKLVKGKDYDKTFKYYADGKELSETACVPAGTEITVVVTYKEGSMFVGSVSTTYRVVESNLNRAKLSCVNDVITVTLGGVTLKEGTDYEIISKTQVNNGNTFKVQLHGLGAYGKTKTLKVTRKFR